MLSHFSALLFSDIFSAPPHPGCVPLRVPCKPCPLGMDYGVDEEGCPSCQCKPKTDVVNTCPPLTCPVCEDGRVRSTGAMDERGCPTCGDCVTNAPTSGKGHSISGSKTAIQPFMVGSIPG